MARTRKKTVPEDKSKDLVTARENLIWDSQGKLKWTKEVRIIEHKLTNKQYYELVKHTNTYYIAIAHAANNSLAEVAYYASADCFRSVLLDRDQYIEYQRNQNNPQELINFLNGLFIKYGEDWKKPHQMIKLGKDSVTDADSQLAQETTSDPNPQAIQKKKINGEISKYGFFNSDILCAFKKNGIISSQGYQRVKNVSTINPKNSAVYLSEIQKVQDQYFFSYWFKPKNSSVQKLIDRELGDYKYKYFDINDYVPDMEIEPNVVYIKYRPTNQYSHEQSFFEIKYRRHDNTIFYDKILVDKMPTALLPKEVINHPKDIKYYNSIGNKIIKNSKVEFEKYVFQTIIAPQINFYTQCVGENGQIDFGAAEFKKQIVHILRVIQSYSGTNETKKNGVDYFCSIVRGLLSDQHQALWYTIDGRKDITTQIGAALKSLEEIEKYCYSDSGKIGAFFRQSMSSLRPRIEKASALLKSIDLEVAKANLVANV